MANRAVHPLGARGDDAGRAIHPVGVSLPEGVHPLPPSSFAQMLTKMTSPRCSVAKGKTETRIIVINFAQASMQVEVARCGVGRVDDKIETRGFANVLEIGVGLLGEDRHRAAGESEFAICDVWVFPEKLSDGERRVGLLEIAPIAQLGRGHIVLFRRRRASTRNGQSALPSWLILAVATSSIIARSSSGTAIGVQALSPSMKNTMPPERPSILMSAALSP